MKHVVKIDFQNRAYISSLYFVQRFRGRLSTQ